MINRNSFFYFLLTFCFISLPASATSILNLSKETYTVEINVLQRLSQVTLAPGERWESELYPIRVRIGTTDWSAVLEPEGEYGLWKGGVLTLQKRDRSFKSHR